MDKLAFPLGLTTAFLMGAYCGVFAGEASAIYQCEKDKALVIKGAFWKGEIKYYCAQALLSQQTQEGGKNG